MQKKVIFLLFCLFTYTVEASECSLIVRSKGKGTALAKTEVVVDDNTVFYADNLGKVAFTCPQLQLKVYKAGYQVKIIVTKNVAPNKLLEVFLVPSQPQDTIIYIKGRKGQEPSKKVVTIKEAIEVSPQGDPVQIAKLLPGVRSSVLRPDISVRGSSPDDSKYYLDDFEIPFIYHTISGLSVIPSSLISDIKFYAGGFSPQFGDATGGIIEVSSKKEVLTAKETKIIINMPIYSSVYYGAPLSKTSSLTVSARRSYVDALVKAFFAKKDSVVIPTFWDAHIRYLVKYDNASLQYLLLTSYDGLSLSIPNDAAASKDGNFNFNLSSNFVVSGVEWKKKINSNWRYTTTPQVRYTKFNTQVLDSNVSIDGVTFRWPIYWQYRLPSRKKLRFGLEWRHNVAFVDVLAPRVVQDDPFIDYEEAPQIKSKSKYTANYYLGWTTIDLLVTSRLLLTPGVRLFYATQLTKNGYDPRLQAQYKISEEARLKASIGQYSKRPLPQESDSEFGNTQLDFERTMHYVFGWEQDWSDLWTTDVQLYTKKGWDIVRSSPIMRYENSGELRSWGLELFVRRNPTERTFGWVSYTYSRTTERKSSLEAWVPSQYDQAHNVNFVGHYKLTGQWGLGGRLNYHTGDRYTPIDYAVYNASFDKYQPRYQKEQTYANTLPDYYQIDVFAYKNFLYNYWQLKLRFGAEYLALERPAFGVQYNYNYKQKTYFRGLPPIPYLQLEASF